MCHFIREFLNFYKREEGQFNPFPSDPWADVDIFLLFKNLFVKYQCNVLHIDHYVTYNDFKFFFQKSILNECISKAKKIIDEKKTIFQLYQNDFHYIMRFFKNAIDAGISFCKWL